MPVLIHTHPYIRVYMCLYSNNYIYIYIEQSRAERNREMYGTGEESVHIPPELTKRMSRVSAGGIALVECPFSRRYAGLFGLLTSR